MSDEKLHHLEWDELPDSLKKLWDSYLDSSVGVSMIRAVEKDYATLKAQRDDLLEALKGSLEMMKQFSSYRKTQGLTAGNVFLDSTIEQAEKAIEHCK